MYPAEQPPQPRRQSSPPTPAFTVRTACGGLSVFEAYGSTDADGAVTSWTWEFGDGETAQGPVVQHRYAAPGTYLVWLVVHDDEGGSARTPHRLTIRECQPLRLSTQSLLGVERQALHGCPQASGGQGGYRFTAQLAVDGRREPLPGSARIDTATGCLEWTEAVAGTHCILLQVTDGQTSDEGCWLVQVTPDSARSPDGMDKGVDPAPPDADGAPEGGQLPAEPPGPEDDPGPTPDAGPADPVQSGPGPWPWLIGGVLAVALTLAIVGVRRRRRSGPRA